MRFPVRDDEVSDGVLYCWSSGIVEKHVAIRRQPAVPIFDVGRAPLIAVVAVNKQHIVCADRRKLPLLAVANDELDVGAYAGLLEYLL